MVVNISLIFTLAYDIKFSYEIRTEAELRLDS
jgi:hypothetical protein